MTYYTMEKHARRMRNMHERILLLSYIIILTLVPMSWSEVHDIELVGQEPFGPTNSAYIHNGYAYLCAGGSLIILDAKNPADLIEVGQITTSGNSGLRVYVSGNLAYVADYGDFRILDVSDPGASKEIGSLTKIGGITDIYVSSGYCYVVVHEGLRIIDAREPAKPEILGIYERPGVRGVQVSGNYAYVTGDEGLCVVDVSDPSNPKEVSSIAATPGDGIRGFQKLGLCLSSIYAYIADGKDRGMRIVDISDPKTPKEVGFADTPGDANGVCISGSLAYVADGDEGMQVIDVSDPKIPKEVASYFTGGYVSQIQVVGDYAFVVDGDLRVFDVSEPGKLKELEFFYDCPGGAGDVHVSGKYAHIADKDGLRVIDVSDVAKPIEVGFCSIPGDSRRVHIRNGYAYLLSNVPRYMRYQLPSGRTSSGWATEKGSVHVIDISDPGDPKEVGSWNTAKAADGIYVLDSYAYVAAGGSLYVIDVSDPTRPSEVGRCRIPDSGGTEDWNFLPRNIRSKSQDIYVSNGYAYIADGDAGLQIADISDPKAPELVGSLDIHNYVNGVSVISGYAYVVTKYEGYLAVIDISDPRTPKEIKLCCRAGTRTYGIHTLEDRAYMITGMGINVIDISDPNNPVLERRIRIPGYGGFAVDVSSGYAYIASGQSGLYIAKLP